jgi:hypothetical protein
MYHMRKEDIPPANEYERGFLISGRRSECSKVESKVESVALVVAFVSRLLDFQLAFTRLRICSLDDRILLNLQRKPGRVNVYPMTLTDERKERMEEFSARKGLEPFAEHFGHPPWWDETIIGYVLKGEPIEVAALVTELLMCVYCVKGEEEFHFTLM